MVIWIWAIRAIKIRVSGDAYVCKENACVCIPKLAYAGQFLEGQNFIFVGPKASLFDGPQTLDPLGSPKPSK